MTNYQTVIDKVKTLYRKHFRFWRLGTDYDILLAKLKELSIPYEVVRGKEAGMFRRKFCVIYFGSSTSSTNYARLSTNYAYFRTGTGKLDEYYISDLSDRLL